MLITTKIRRINDSKKIKRHFNLVLYPRSSMRYDDVMYNSESLRKLQFIHNVRALQALVALSNGNSLVVVFDKGISACLW